MAYLAQCAPERIPMTLVESAVENETERLEALAALAEVSLLKHDPFEDDTPAVTVAVTYLDSRAAYSQAMAVCDVLAKCEKVLGPEHPLTAESLSNLAVMLRPGSGRPCRGKAALRARTGNPRKGARPRASHYGDEP
jgi:hypothetical protein